MLAWAEEIDLVILVHQQAQLLNLLVLLRCQHISNLRWQVPAGSHTSAFLHWIERFQHS